MLKQGNDKMDKRDSDADSGNPGKLVDDTEIVDKEADVIPFEDFDDIKKEAEIDGDHFDNEDGFYEDEGSRISGEELDEEMKDDAHLDANMQDQRTKKKTSMSKLCSCLSRAKRVHMFRSDDISEGSLFDARPPLPANMPIADDMRKRLEYRNEKVRYGKEKIEFYIRVCKHIIHYLRSLIPRSRKRSSAR